MRVDEVVALLPVHEGSLSERDSLVAFFNCTGGSQWRNRTRWLSTQPVCQWLGVRCSQSPAAAVIEVNLTSNGLVGQMSCTSLLSDLRQLSRLYLSMNQLSGPLPTFSNFTSLTQLWLNSNDITGGIDNLIPLGNLEGLVLSSNRFRGTIPDFAMPRLVVLTLRCCVLLLIML